ncbi:MULTISPECIES: Gldg family protein [Butyricimonas]|uniref:Gldg family protein n=1 Tax=Butyricimonas TaxID=574697 RepID=UPI001D0684A2|nr:MULTISPECIES: Gldg family protein [Butyricimonas]MCB6974697.1 Gldg family protein [Butyricimonas synergistica]MCG4521449.1 Gldg family protein [Butyricimonas sp. DFI.6.44]
MKKIFKIAKMELQTLFYSPIAWLILVIFVFQAVTNFMGNMERLVHSQEIGYTVNNITNKLFSAPWTGLFTAVQGYLYLYIPLLTMGLMSRELSSGSIKLLYSSPVTNWQIILGKYLSMMLYGGVLIMALLVIVVFGAFTVKDFDFPLILSGLLGLYFLICAYAAVGLFMSSLTSYQVVVAIMTLVILGLLNYVKDLWQEFELVREITYWLSISGRSGEFISGLICSEDVIYFITVSALFLVLTVIRLQANRQKARWTMTIGKYMGVLLIASVIGYFSSRPTLMTYYDTTATKSNTLTENSQDVVAKMKGGLTITTYVNALDLNDLRTAMPDQVKRDQEHFRQYVRFKPEIKMKYVYYYDTITDAYQDKRWPDKNTKERFQEVVKNYHLDSTLFITPEEIRKQIDLWPEGNRFVRLLERESGEKTFLRVYNDMIHQPLETEITAAFKRLVMDLPKVGFLTGHGERDVKKLGTRDYNTFTWDKPFRYALLNQGFDVVEVGLDGEIPEDINILVIAEMRSELSLVQKENLDQYVARGGNLMILSEPKREEYMNPLLAEFGVQLVPGCLVHVSGNHAPDLMVVKPTKEGQELIYHFEQMNSHESVVVHPGVSGLTFIPKKGYKAIPLFETDSLVWNEMQTTDFVDDTARLNPELGEVQQRYVTTLALMREVDGRTQKILVFGDADCISNGELSMGRKGIRTSNFTLIPGSFFWLSDEEVPIDVRRPIPPDNLIYLSEKEVSTWTVILRWIIPSLMIVLALVIWLRRRGR